MLTTVSGQAIPPASYPERPQGRGGEIHLGHNDGSTQIDIHIRVDSQLRLSLFTHWQYLYLRFHDIRLKHNKEGPSRVRLSFASTTLDYPFTTTCQSSIYLITGSLHRVFYK
jgi:hypothetical protein